MLKVRLTREMKSALRSMLDGRTSSIIRDTLSGLTNRALIDTEENFTIAGWNHAVSLVPLQKQCACLGIEYERLEGLQFQGQPEYAAWEYYNSQGYIGGYCEGGAILLLIRAAALDIFSKLILQETICLDYANAGRTLAEASPRANSKCIKITLKRF